MSCTPVRMRLLDDAHGIVVFVGNKVCMSQTRNALVSHNHTV